MLRRNMTPPTSIDQLWGKYRRLRGELAMAYAEPQWNRARLDRLADEIATLEVELARRAPAPAPAARSPSEAVAARPPG
jgi:hypothetical protein